MDTEKLFSIKQSLEIYGYSVVGPITTTGFNQEAINEIIEHLESQPRVDNKNLKIDKITGINSDDLKKLKSAWVPFAQSGKVHEPPSFHMSKCWELRQMPFLYKIFKTIFNDEDLRVSLDCYEAKLPKEGEKKKLFWKFHPSSWNFDKNDYQGFLALNQNSFSCVPGSHTQDFQNSLKYYYEYLWTENKTQIDPKRDPWQLEKLEKEIIIPPGHFLIWDDKLLISKYVNLENRIKFGYHITYQQANRCRLTDEQRLYSFLTGLSPGLDNYGQSVNYMPKAWKSFPNKVKEYWQRLPSELQQYRISKTNVKLPCIIEPIDDDYVCPTLTPLGNKLLFGRPAIEYTTNNYNKRLNSYS